MSVRRWWQLSQANGAMRARSPLDALARGLRLCCHCATSGGTSGGHGVAGGADRGPDRDPVVGFLPHHGAPPAQRDQRQSIWVVSSRRPAPRPRAKRPRLAALGQPPSSSGRVPRRCSLEVFSGVLRRSKHYVRRLWHRVRALGR
jgi:hypothetical protein